tara:strand:- start:24167 stop:25714 length:1548 start_codon:yes stop_codon:yes gene_type:complete
MKLFNCYLYYENLYKGESCYKDHYTYVFENLFPLNTKYYQFNLIDNLKQSDIVIIPINFTYDQKIYDDIKNKKLILILLTDHVDSMCYNLIQNKSFNILANTILFLEANSFTDKNNYLKNLNTRYFYTAYKDPSFLNSKTDYNYNTSIKQCLIPHFLRFYFYHDKNHYLIPFNNLNGEKYTKNLLIQNIDKMININNIDFSKKIYDISFVGCLDYGEQTIPTEHRKKLVKYLNDLKKKSTYNIFVSDKKITKENMIELMLKTKIFISPWGIGEYSGKDYESILLGCILFKPSFYSDKNHYCSYPNIYNNNETCIFYKYDNSDLNDKINNTLINYKNLSVYFNKNILNLFSNLTIENIKKDYINYFDNILEKKLLCNSDILNIEYNTDVIYLNLFRLCNNNKYINITFYENEFVINVKHMYENENKDIHSTGIGFNGNISSREFNIQIDIKIDSEQDKSLIYYNGKEYLNHKNKINANYNTFIFKNIFNIDKFRFFVDYKQLNEDFNIFFKNIKLI